MYDPAKLRMVPVSPRLFLCVESTRMESPFANGAHSLDFDFGFMLEAEDAIVAFEGGCNLEVSLIWQRNCEARRERLVSRLSTASSSEDKVAISFDIDLF